jgi:acetyl-CoA carboxylase biotin carboxyl carrier protein
MAAPSPAPEAAAEPGANPDTRRQTSSRRAGSGTSAGAGGPMDVGLLAELVKLMAANDLNTVEVRDGDKRVVLKRGPAAPSFTYGAPMPAPSLAPSASQPQAGAGGGTGSAAPAPDESAGLVAIKAEMVGTFYSSPKPGEPVFVNVGSTVDDETTICVIEAMKNFFPVKAGVRGSIAKVLVQNGQTVQFDQPLFLIKPA